MQSDELLITTRRCAIAFGFGDQNEDALKGVVLRLSAASKAVMQELFVEDSDYGLVLSAINFMACWKYSEGKDQLIAQYPVSLKVLLRLVLSAPKILTEECGEYLTCLGSASAATAKRFDDEAPDRAEAVRKAREQFEVEQSIELRRLVEGSLHSEMMAPKATVDIPSHWVAAAVGRGDWVDQQLRDAVLEIRADETVEAPYFKVDTRNAASPFRCGITFGHGAMRVTIEGAAASNAQSAFRDAMRLLDMCPQEPTFRPSKVEFGDIDPRNKPTRLSMRNIVPVGIPLYVATASWGENFHESKNTTPRSTIGQAITEIVAVVSARASTRGPASCVAIKEDTSAPPDYPRLLGVHGFDRGNVKFLRSKEGWCAELNWYSREGAEMRHTSKETRPSKEDAFAFAVACARMLPTVDEMDWAEVARHQLKTVAPVGLAVSFREIGGQGYAACCVWEDGKKHLLRGPQAATKADALHQLCEILRPGLQQRREISSLLATLKSPTKETALKLQTVMKRMTPNWLSEREILLRLNVRTEPEERRMQELSSLLAIGDPLRRNAVDRQSIFALVEKALLEAKLACLSTDVSMTRLQQEGALSALTNGVNIEAGAALNITEKWERFCVKLGRTPEDVQDALVAMKLVNRKNSGKLTLTESGVGVLSKTWQTSAFAKKLVDSIGARDS